MFKVRHLLAAAALLTLAGCVTDDSGYGYGYGGYSYPSYGYPSYGYALPAYDGSHAYRSGQVLCRLPGEDAWTSPGECRQLQRRYGTSERDAQRRQKWAEDRRERWERDRDRNRDREIRERIRERLERDRDRGDWRGRGSRYEQPGASSRRCPAPLTVGPRGTCVGQTE